MSPPDLAGRVVVRLPADRESLRLADAPPTWVSLAVVSPAEPGEEPRVLRLGAVPLLSMDLGESGASLFVALSPEEADRLLRMPAGSVAQVVLPIRASGEGEGPAKESPGTSGGEGSE